MDRDGKSGVDTARERGLTCERFCDWGDMVRRARENVLRKRLRFLAGAASSLVFFFTLSFAAWQSPSSPQTPLSQFGFTVHRKKPLRCHPEPPCRPLRGRARKGIRDLQSLLILLPPLQLFLPLPFPQSEISNLKFEISVSVCRSLSRRRCLHTPIVRASSPTKPAFFTPNQSQRMPKRFNVFAAPRCPHLSPLL